MAERLVTRTYRDQDGDIKAIGNPETPWIQRNIEWAIEDIQSGRHRYYVEGNESSIQIWIDVIDDPDGPYLRTRADGTTENNLDNLPSLDFYPWNIAHDNAQILAVHAALIPHGREGEVLLFGGNEHDSQNADNNEHDNTRIYEIDRNRIAEIDSPEADVFCCEHAFLADGRLFIGGGTEFWRHATPDHFDMHAIPRDHWSGAPECAIYSFDNSWDQAANMLPEPDQENRGGGRWYPTLITLADGRILAVGGHPRLSDGRHGAWLPEIYNPANNTWTYSPGHWIYVNWADIPVLRERVEPPEDPEEVPDPSDGEPIYNEEGQLIELLEFPEGQTRPNNDPDRGWNYLYYPRLYVVPGGHIFMVSPNDGFCGWYNPNTGLIDDIRVSPPAHGSGYSETNHTAVLLPLLPGDNYTPHILFFGMEGPRRITLSEGATVDNPPDWQETVARDWVGTPPLRRHGCATLLPTGEVIFTGGINNDGAVRLPDDDATLRAEIYNPGINWETNQIDFVEESWATTPPAFVPRNYHSVALLLPNGRILTAGSNLDGRSGQDDVKEYRIEMFTPNYFYDVNRPQIISAPDSLNYGESFTINTTDLNEIERVALMRCGTVTHAWDGDQRYVGLEFTINEENITAIAPPDGSIAPPGPYMLWVIDRANRPCRLAPFVILS